jgi:hypothetical protein
MTRPNRSLTTLIADERAQVLAIARRSAYLTLAGACTLCGAAFLVGVQLGLIYLQP